MNKEQIKGYCYNSNTNQLGGDTIDIVAIESRYNIKVQPAMPLIEKLLSRIEQYEHRYGMSSANMLIALKQDKIEETGDICNWMQDVQIVKSLKNGSNGI